MQRIAWLATGVILLNLAVSLLHGSAHQQLHVDLNTWQWAFVMITNIAGPILALTLYWTSYRRAASLILFVSMFAILLFGVYFHFVFTSNDHIAHLPEGEGRGLFIVTAFLLIPVQAAGAIFALWSWVQLRREVGAKQP